MPVGKVKWFNPEKGFGFIEPEGGGPDVFFEAGEIERAGLALQPEGETVTFDLDEDAAGRPRALRLCFGGPHGSGGGPGD